LLDDVDRGAANPWGVTTTADGATILVSHSGTHELSAIDAKRLLEKLARVSTSPAGVQVASDLSFLVGLRRRIGLEGVGPRGLAAIGSKVYVAEYFSDTLGVVNLAAEGLGRAGQIALGPKPKLTAARRGELVFHDARRSFQHWQSCATCHPDGRADGLNWDLLNDGLGNPKNTRSMLLVHQGGPAMSLGVRATAESAVRAGFLHSLFATTREADALAVDTYLKSLAPVPSPHLIDGRLSQAARRGKELFFDPKVGCAACHAGPAYTDKKLHNVASQGKLDDPNDKFTTPRLVEVWRTAPYMHDGQYLTIKELLVEGKHGRNGDEVAQLSDVEIDDLVEFVLSL
jgi:mono/diheme cytochrome c family protein